MSDLTDQYQTALDKAAEYEMLGILTVDAKKRKAYRNRAQLHQSIADELRAKLESLPKCQEMSLR